MRHFLFAAALLVAAPLSATTIRQAPPELPGWLAGAWEQVEAEQWSDEFWTPPRGDIMIGAARVGQGAKLTIFEHTRIIRKPDGSLAFLAQPRGVPASEFPLVAASATMVEFANPAHDYPQRIRYWRDGPLLRARVSLIDGSNAMEWTYRPMGSGR
ncbi:MAG: DUF6265 family protein [Novosphingobium sp.]